MVKKVYLETSFVSAMVTDRTDPASLYRRQESLDWWAKQSQLHSLFISAEVIRELSNPEFPLKDEALDVVKSLPLLTISQDVLGLAAILVSERVMPQSVAGDALHVAVSTVHQMDFILSWNVKHLANPNKFRHLQTVCTRAGYLAPALITPDLLWEDTNGN